MAEKISIEIGLEGGDEVKRQLQDVEKTGVQTFTGIKEAADQLDFSSIADGFQQVGETGVQAFDKVKQAVQSAVVFEQVVQGVKKVEGAFEALGNAATKMAARMTRSLGILGVFARALGPVGIAIGAAGGAFIKFGDDAADAINGLTVAAAKLGQTPQQLDTVQKGLAQLGVAANTIIPGLEKFKESLGGDLFTGDLNAQLGRFIGQLERMPDGVQRTQLAIATLGEALGGQVIAGLQTGTLNAKNYATALAGITPVTQQQIVEAGKYQTSLNLLNAAWNDLKTAFVPITTPLFSILTQELKDLKNDIGTIRLELAFLKGIWDVFTATLSGADPGAAARKAAEDYKQLEAEIRGTGAAAAQAGQQGAQSAVLVQDPWTGLSTTLDKVNQGFAQVGQTATQSGQQGAQAGQTAAGGFQVWNEELGKAVPAIQQAGQAGAQAGQQVATGMQPANQALSQTATQANTTAQAVQQVQPPDASSWTSWGQTVISWLQKAIDKLWEWIGLKDKTGGSGGGGGGSDVPGKAHGGLIGGRGTGTSDSNLAWVSRGEHIMPARVVRQPGVLGFLEALRRSGGNLPGYAKGGTVKGSPFPFDFNTFVGVFNQVIDQLDAAQNAIKDADLANIENLRQINNALVSSIKQAMGSLAEISQTAYDALIASAKSLSQNLAGVQKTIESAANALQSLQGAGGKARGGLLGGRGSGTSDSNLAWVSRGEYITPARAVRQPGVLAFLEALRRSGGNLSRVLDGMGRFALGGLVPRPMPAFAAGGLNGSMSNVTIQFPGLPEIGGLRASSEVVDELRKIAALAQVRSGGRKPSRYS